MGPLDDEPRFETVSAPDEWPWTTDGPVRYVAVHHGDLLLGYLWAAEDDQAAGFVPAASAGDAGDNAGVAWVGLLREAKASGLRPLDTLRHWADGPDSGHGVPRGAESRAGLDDLVRLAAAT
jgi:hypothetical protein